MSRSSEFLQTLTFPEGIAPAEGLEDAHSMLQNEFAPMVSDRLQQLYEVGADPKVIIPLAGGLHPLGYSLREMNKRVLQGTMSNDVFDQIAQHITFADIRTGTDKTPSMATVQFSQDIRDGEPICIIDDIADTLWVYNVLRKKFQDSPLEMYVPVTRRTTSARIAFEILPITWCRAVGPEWIKGSCGLNDGKFVQDPYPYTDAEACIEEAELSAIQRLSIMGTARKTGSSGKQASRTEQLEFYRTIALQSILKDTRLWEAHCFLESLRQQTKLTGQINHEPAFEIAEHIVEYNREHPGLYD